MKCGVARCFIVGGMMASLLFGLGIMLGQQRRPSKEERPERIDINTASVQELAQLPGIGETRAKSIVRHREVVGWFRSVVELLAIKGISRQMLESFIDRVTVGQPPLNEKDS